VPMVTVPYPTMPSGPPASVPQAPQPNYDKMVPTNPQLTPPPGYANAFTRPGPQRPVPAETIPPEGTVNAFTTPIITGQGTPPPAFPALLQPSPARWMLTGCVPGYPMPPNQCPPGAPQGMPMPNPTPGLPMPSAGMQGAPSAWIQAPNYLPANYIPTPQAGNAYNTPQGVMPAVYP